MEITNIKVSGFENAILGMRNPMMSHDKSDSEFGIASDRDFDDVYFEFLSKQGIANDDWIAENCTLNYGEHALEYVLLGKEDLRLAQNLVLAGSDHSKFMRQIFVSMDIKAPTYWFSEADTYKVSTTRNSSSIQHKGAAKPYEITDFAIDEPEIYEALKEQNIEHQSIPNNHLSEEFSYWQYTLRYLNGMREQFLKTKDYIYFRKLRQALPSSYLYYSTWTANYQVLRNIYHSRKNHKLKEWKQFCEMVESLPYAKELICLNENANG